MVSWGDVQSTAMQYAKSCDGGPHRQVRMEHSQVFFLHSSGDSRFLLPHLSIPHLCLPYTPHYAKSARSGTDIRSEKIMRVPEGH